MASKETVKRIAPIVIGVGLIIFGLVLLVNLVGRFIDVQLLLRWWPVAIIAAGFVIVSMDKSRVFVGLSLLLAGTTVLLARLGLLDGVLRDLIEIIVVLLIGLALVTPRVIAYVQKK